MTRPNSQKGGPPGRKTRVQEIEEWLQGLDLPPEVAQAINTADPRVQVLPAGAPGNFREMRERAAQDLWTYFQGAGGVAKVQAFKAISALADREGQTDPDAEPEPLIADVVTGVASLSPIRKREILTAEQAKLQVELAGVDEALARMDEAVAV